MSPSVPKPRKKPRKKPLQRSAPKRKAPPRKVNRKRKASSFARAYGSKARVEFVKALPCIVGVRLFCQIPSDNAHVGHGGGAGFKGPYTEIAPICPIHHIVLHRHGRQWFERRYGLDLDAEAQKCEQAWQEHSGGSPKIEHLRAPFGEVSQ